MARGEWKQRREYPYRVSRPKRSHHRSEASGGRWVRPGDAPPRPRVSPEVRNQINRKKRRTSPVYKRLGRVIAAVGGIPTGGIRFTDEYKREKAKLERRKALKGY